MDATVRGEVEALLPAELGLLVEFYAFGPIDDTYQLLVECIRSGELEATRRVYLAFWADNALFVTRDVGGSPHASYIGIGLATAWSERCGRDIRRLLRSASVEHRKALEAVCGWLGLDLPAVMQPQCDVCRVRSASGDVRECRGWHHLLDPIFEAMNDIAGLLCEPHARKQGWRPCGACGDWHCRDCAAFIHDNLGWSSCAKCSAFICCLTTLCATCQEVSRETQARGAPETEHHPRSSSGSEIFRQTIPGV